MTKMERRREIVRIIRESREPVPAKELARLCDVSRQVIVQDMALIREAGIDIIATNRGYIVNTPHAVQRVFKVSHTDEQMEDELCAIVDLGGKVVNVMINHRVYGRMEARLDINSRKKVTEFIVEKRKIILVIFLVLLIPAYIIQGKTEVYYKLDSSIPESYEYTQAMTKLREDYGMESQMMILTRSETSNANVNAMAHEIEGLDGVDAVVGSSLLSDYGISTEILGDELRDVMETENYSMMLVLSNYGIATDELNEQIVRINEIVNSYDDGAIVAGEGPLMKDLVETSDRDFTNVNFVSIGVIFVIMALVLKSISLPVLLMAAIEFAIFLNLGAAFLTGTEIPFIASIVIGTIQLGATIDYAILLTTKYLEERQNGKAKIQAAKTALGSSIQSIFVSAMCFFGATIGVGLFSQIDMIGSLCTLIARGAIISMVIVVTVVPALLVSCDGLIRKTTLGFNKR